MREKNKPQEHSNKKEKTQLEKTQLEKLRKEYRNLKDIVKNAVLNSGDGYTLLGKKFVTRPDNANNFSSVIDRSDVEETLQRIITFLDLVLDPGKKIEIKGFSFDGTPTPKEVAEKLICRDGSTEERIPADLKEVKDKFINDYSSIKDYLSIKKAIKKAIKKPFFKRNKGNTKNRSRKKNIANKAQDAINKKRYSDILKSYNDTLRRSRIENKAQDANEKIKYYNKILEWRGDLQKPRDKKDKTKWMKALLKNFWSYVRHPSTLLVSSFILKRKRDSLVEMLKIIGPDKHPKDRYSNKNTKSGLQTIDETKAMNEFHKGKEENTDHNNSSLYIHKNFSDKHKETKPSKQTKTKKLEELYSESKNVGAFSTLTFFTKSNTQKIIEDTKKLIIEEEKVSGLNNP